MTTLRNVILVLFAWQLVACDGGWRTTASITARAASPSNSSQPTSTPPPTLDNGTYLSVDQFISSFDPVAIVSITINGNSFTANETYDGSTPMSQTGTFVLDPVKGLLLTQQSLTMTPASGQAANISCTGLTLSDNTATSVAGVTCNGFTFTANSVVVPTYLFHSNESALSYHYNAMVAPVSFSSGDFSLEFSLVLQTPLRQFQPITTTPGDGNYVAQADPMADTVMVASEVAPTEQFVVINSIAFSGNNFIVTGVLEDPNGAQPVNIATITEQGYFTSNSGGYMTFVQTSLTLVPFAGEASSVDCTGFSVAEGQTVNIGGATCNQKIFQVNGTPFGSGLTVVNATTLSPCSETFVNCQFDPLASYVLIQ